MFAAGFLEWRYVFLTFHATPMLSYPKKLISVGAQSAVGFKWVIFDRLQPSTKCTVLETDRVELALTPDIPTCKKSFQGGIL